MDQSKQRRKHSGREMGTPEATGAPSRDKRRDHSATTIRAVTPESIPEEGFASQTYASSPPVSPRSGGSQTSRNSNPRTFVARANSNDNDYASSLRHAREAGTRTSTRTLEER